jgi:hypothetical protein
VTVAYSRGQTTDALLSALRTAFGSTKVYDMLVPGDASSPYLLVMPVDGGSTTGPGLVDPDATIASAPGGVTTSGTSPQVLFVTQDRFTLWITPSS